MLYAIIIMNYVLIIQLMYNIYMYMSLRFMMNKLTCKRMNMSVWCGESGQQQVLITLHGGGTIRKILYIIHL